MTRPQRVNVVPHTHWDREWYRTFQAFRARLVDTVDRVDELLGEDDGYRFLLVGQSIVLEDYLEIRPDRRADLERAVRAGRVEIGRISNPAGDANPQNGVPVGICRTRDTLGALWSEIRG